jgi:hypothetical protein
MRKLTLVVMILLLAATPIFAQKAIMKGAWDLGGSFTFSSAGGDLYKNAAGDGQSTIQFAPDLGYFFMDHFSVGLLINYMSWSQGDNKMSDFTFGPRLNYYFEKMGSGNPYVHLSYLMGSSKTDPGAHKYSTSNLKLGVGYLAWLSDYVALNPMITYSMDSGKPDGGTSTSGSVLGIGIGFKIFHF